MDTGRQINFEDNIFDLLRLWAILQVTIGHCTQHLQVALPSGVMIFFNFPGVVALFAISGFLVTASYDRLMNRPNGKKEYIKRRALRIFPGLWCSILVSSVCIFLFYSQRPSLPEGIIYLFTQFLGCNFYTGGWLRGYGVGAPNGSLWTISTELQFYILIMIIWKWLKKKGIITWVVILTSGVMINVVSGVLGRAGYAESIPYKLFQNSMLPYIYIFMIGAMAYRYLTELLNIVRNMWKVLFVVVCAFLGMRLGPDCVQAGAYVNIVFGIALAALTITAAYVFKRKLRLPFDISYGIYLYHMVIVNVMVECGMTEKPQYLVAVLLASLGCGFLSWYVVEKRWLERGKNRE